jgi:hypothetical protein
MRMIFTSVARKLRVDLLRTMIAALWVLAAYPALAQEGGPAAGGGGSAAPAAPDGAAAPSRDVEPFTPQRGSAGLWRRANLKALIANRPNNTANLPPATVRIAPLPVRPGGDTAPQRNAIGVALPGAQSPGHSIAGVATSAGNRPAGIGTPAAPVGMARSTPSLNPSQAPRGAGINGTTMGRMASGPGSIGGPAKDRTSINGTLMSRKH